jgi:hypothetical protein
MHPFILVGLLEGGSPHRMASIYEGRLQSSWTHLITLSRNFVEVWWRSLFRSTSLGMRCTSYNAPPTSRKRATARWSLRNFLPRSSLFMIGKSQKLHTVRSELNSVLRVERWSGGTPIEHPRREVLRKRDRHRTSTKFRLRVIRWVHELFKLPSYTGQHNTQNVDIIDASNGIQTHDPSFGAVQDRTRLRARGHGDLLNCVIKLFIYRPIYK